MRIRAIIFAVTCSATAAQAEGWTVSPVDPVASATACVQLAADVSRRYRTVYSGGGIAFGDTNHYAYDLGPGNNDALFMCGVNPPQIVIHGDRGVEREAVMDRLKEFWRQMK